MNEHWWRKRKKHPWYDAFDEFDRLEEMTRRVSETPPERIREERESLVDVMEEDKDVVIVAELPGVEKDDIKIHATEDYLTISVNTPERGYHKELTLPAKVNPQSARASYKNGVLEVKLKKLVMETPIKS